MARDTSSTIQPAAGVHPTTDNGMPRRCGWTDANAAAIAEDHELQLWQLIGRGLTRYLHGPLNPANGPMAPDIIDRFARGLTPIEIPTSEVERVRQFLVEAGVPFELEAAGKVAKGGMS